MPANDSPLISVIVATYNRSDLLREAVDSVLAQTCTDFELIISDDGSTDNTKEVVSAFEDPRISFLELTHNGLPAATRNRGIEKVKGEFVALLDSDDLWLPHKLETCLAHFRQNPSTGLFCSNEYLLNSGVPNSGQKNLLQKNARDRYVTFQQLLQGNPVSTSTVVLRKECLEQVGNFDESIDFFTVEDWHLWARVAARFRIFFSKEPLGYYRIHGNNICLDTGVALVNKYKAVKDIMGKFPGFTEQSDALGKKALRNMAHTLGKFYLKKGGIGKSIKWLTRSFMI